MENVEDVVDVHQVLGLQSRPEPHTITHFCTNAASLVTLVTFTVCATTYKWPMTLYIIPDYSLYHFYIAVCR